MVGRSNSEPRSNMGRLILGHAAAHRELPDGQKPVSSIPAKFETVLFTGPREKKGFGSVSRRFDGVEPDNPGPGAYVQIGDTMEYKHDSIGKKGYGPLTSKSQRFARSRAAFMPGPGDYTPRKEPLEPESFNRAPVTAAFHPPVKPVRPIPNDDCAAPGPGSYMAEEITRTGQKLEWEATSHTHKSAFKATPHKLQLVGNLESPASTKYTLVDPWDPSSGSNKAASRTPSKAGLSSFAGRSGGSGSLTQMSPAMFLEDPKASKKPDTGPGPGSYELQYYESIRTGQERVMGKTSANFQPLEYVDRFGKSLAQTNAYSDYNSVPIAMASVDGRGRISSPTPGVSAPFKSNTAGRAEFDLKEAGKAPGPAFYSPQAPPKRTSYHLNARKRMVA